MSDTLKQHRDRIDTIDEEILDLVNRRAEHAKAIGNLKNDGPVYRAEREAQILRRLGEKNPGPLAQKSVLGVFSEIISACRALEETLSVAFLGPEGTFSEEAAMKQFGSAVTPVRCANIDDVFANVESGTVGYGVVPVENSSEGAFTPSIGIAL